MNMIRVWGGGIYERDLFYELCDRLGLMVWQDFMFACGEYPEQPWFLKNVQSEAEIAVKQLRNHPSLVLWCGNNECEWIFCANNPGKRPNDMTGARIFRKVLPGVCRTLDGTRPYWRSSPFGSGFPNDESNGNHHQWRVWSQWVDFREYEKDHGRFVTEFGFQAPATVRTMESCTLPEDRLPQGKVLEHHNKQVEGTERLIRFVGGHYLVDTDFDRFTYLGQLLQAEALKCAVEHWRRRKYCTAGALFWQLNDCWPVTSWSVIDSGLRPKAAYFYAKRFFAPILVSFSRRGSQLEIWVTNDTDTNVAGTLTVDCRSFDGEIVRIDRADVTVGRDASQRLLVLDESVLQQVQRDRQYFHAQLWVEGAAVAENREFLEEPKHLLLPEPEVQLDFREESDVCVVLRVSAKRFLRDLEVDVEGTDALFDDNYVDVDPGSTRDIRIRSTFPLPRLETKIRLRWLR